MARLPHCLSADVTTQGGRTGRPPVPGMYANVNLAFGTYEYNIPEVVGKSFVNQAPHSVWEEDAARFLSALSKIVYEASSRNGYAHTPTIARLRFNVSLKEAN